MSIRPADQIVHKAAWLYYTHGLRQDEVAKRLRYVQAPVLCVANKTDHEKFDADADVFYRFGKKIIRVSTKQNRGKWDLLQAIEERLDSMERAGAERVSPVPRWQFWRNRA